MGLRDHIGSDGIVTTDALIEATKDQIAASRQAQQAMEECGNWEMAARMGDRIDDDLDHLNNLRR